MHALRSTRKLLTGIGLAAFFAGLVPSSASALPVLPGYKGRSYNLFARSTSFINVNRVYMGLNSVGEVGIDSAGRGTVQGGFWPRGSADNYVFNSGLQVAGVVQGTKPANPWAGDTTGGWFFEGTGQNPETEAVTQIYQAFNPADAANWPAEAYVPQGDFVADLYAEPLQGLVSASQGDVHWISWEGNPALLRGRAHPLGIAVDYRILAWNYPAGAQDVVFLVATVYNVTSANLSDYSQHRPAMATLLQSLGQKFQSLNNAKFNITLPVGGYTIGPAFMAVAGDNDVGNENNDYNGVIIPFAMGYTYEGAFDKGKAGWTFDPSIFGAPFFAGVGFVGYKYLKGPDGPGQIQLFTTFCNGNCGGTSGHSDPANQNINYRLLAGTPIATDGQCNEGVPSVTHICFMLTGVVGADTRMALSSSPLTLAPGEGKTVVVAYVYAAPVAIPGFVPGGQTDPGNPTWSESVDSIQKYNGLNRIDSLSGFVKYIGPLVNPDGSKHTPVQTDFQVVPGSLLGKALVAQAVFDAKFLQEFAPDAPQFFLIPGDKQVTVIWKPSATETTGDPYFQIVGSPTVVKNGQTIPNPLYDPNYRKFDVEGYRIYRGRSDTPSALQLIAQFDYAGTTFVDYTGVVANGNCAPELGILTDCPATTPAGGFPTPTNPVTPGTAYTRSVTYNIGPNNIGGSQSPLVLVDQTSGTRIARNGGTTTYTIAPDTVVSGANNGGFPALSDTGVPFIYIDKGVSNGITYYYSVTAFDVNAPGHGPTSLESAKVTKQVIPGAPGANLVTTTSTSTGIFGRKGLLTDKTLPVIDPATGAFNKPFPPTDAVTLSVQGFSPDILNTGSGSVSVQYDSTTITAVVSATSISVLDWYTGTTGSGGKVTVSLPVTIPYSTATVTENGTFPGALGVIDSSLVAKFGGGGGYNVGSAAFSIIRDGTYWTTGQGRGCTNSVYSPGTARAAQCYYSSPRWFVGANEAGNPDTVAPLVQVVASGGGALTGVNYNNAGTLPGVVTVHYPYANGYLINSPWRDVEQGMSPFVTAADYKVYWGAAGKIDSVIDITHDEPVPFKSTINASWGILNPSGAPANTGGDKRAELTAVDIQCVPPLRSFSVTNPAPACTQTYALENTAKPGPIAFFNNALANAQNTTTFPAAANAGFMMYLKGHIYMFELQGGAVPAAGTVWTCRDFVGILYGGKGPAGDLGAYQFIYAPVRPFTAPGSSAGFAFNVSHAELAISTDVLSKVHTVPDPYYVTSAFDRGTDTKAIEFVNVPVGSTIRIYSSSGVLLRVLQNNSTTLSGIVSWDVRNRTNQFVSSGVYFYTVESGGVSHTGRMTIINYASTVQ